MSIALRSATIGNADERITAISLAHPNETALITKDRNVTFDELEAQTNSVAVTLIDRGIGQGDVVAVCLNNGFEIVPLLRGIIRVGAIFVPLDPEHPHERINYFLSDTDARLLITTKTLSSDRQHATRSIALEDLAPYFFKPAPKVNLSLDDPACIIYTSGSTGQPKGVLRLHRGIVSRLAYVPYEPDGIFCHYMSLCYGFSQERILLPLMLGMRLAIFDVECQKDARRLAEEVERFHVTHITLVPAVLQQLISSQHRLYSHLKSIRCVTVASAPLSSEVIDRFHQSLPCAKLINIYGSTECGTLTLGEMTASDEPNVGKPAPNTEVFILNEDLQPVRTGEVGELYGGGWGLASGYWRQPKLTSERFIANPFGTSIPRLYRTGDRGRFLPDGKIQLVGRADRQVKVRGYRVELTEVENALLKVDDLLEVAVVSQPIGYDNRMIAYVCPRSSSSIAVNQLRKHLLQWLPTHMLPSAFVVLESLPRTPMGKLDYQSLPLPGSVRPDLETPYVAPLTPLEDEIASIWAEVLKKDCIGRDDHFLDLGGDSILAVEICAAMENRLGIRIQSVSLFERPTVAEIAQDVSPTAESVGYEIVTHS